MRRSITAGNWKMNLTPEEGASLIKSVLTLGPQLDDNKIIIFCAPYTHLQQANEVIKACGHTNILLGAQNCSQHASGAFTGEISTSMLASLGVQAVVLGHSERRTYFNEGHELLQQKVDAVLLANLTPIFCCGEPLDIREAETHNEYVSIQLSDSLFHLDAQAIVKVVIAYEPIWAIGTGVTASTQQAQDMHQQIRSLLASKYGDEVAQQISILYGGSCNPSNAAELFGQADVDGGLIGGASLKADQFVAVANAM
jgi:triosephosphate isomerase (TIM)